MSYSDLLKHPFWQRKRIEILQRDNFTCTNCSDQLSTLHIHHLYYTFGFPWEYPNDALVTVCHLCHLKYEFIKELNKIILRLKNDFTPSEISQIQILIEKRVWTNMHCQSVTKYIDDIKLLCNG
jgi:hypothetical protein